MSAEDGTVSTHPLDNGERVQRTAGHGWGKGPERHEQDKPQTCHESLGLPDKGMASALELDSARLLTTSPETQGFAYPGKNILEGFESTNGSEYQQSEKGKISSTEALLEAQPGDPEGIGNEDALFPYTKREDGTQVTHCHEEVGSIQEQSNVFSAEGQKFDDTELSIVESEFVELEGDVRSKCKCEIERAAYEPIKSLLLDEDERCGNLQQDQDDSSVDLELDGDSLFIRREMDISILFRDKLRIPKENFLPEDHQAHTSVAQSSNTRTASKAESDTLDQLHFMEREFSAAMVQIEGQSHEIENLKAQLASVEEQFAAQAVFIDDLTASEQRANAEAARLANAITQNKESAEGKDEGSVSQLQKQLSELETRNAFLEDALTQLKSQSEDQAREFVRQAERLNAQTKEVVAREAKLLGELEESQSKYSSEVETCQVLQRNILNLETELDNVKAANQKLEQQVSQMDWVQNNAEACSFRNSQQQPSQDGARSSISGAPREADTQKGIGLHQSAATHGLALNHSHGEFPWSEAKGNYTNNTDEMAAEAFSTRIQEEEVLHRLREERACLDQAENRIRIATMQSSKSLEHVTKELSSVQRARQIAEARAQELEQQLQKTQHNIVTLQHSSQNLPGYLSPTRSEPLRREEASKVSSCQSLLDLQINPTCQDTSSFMNRNDHEQQSLHDHSQARAGIQAQAQAVVQDHATMHIQAQVQAPANAQAPAQVDIQAQETPHTRAGSLPVEAWATSRQSMAPFATESSSRDLQQGFSLLERKLMMINLEREKCEADYARIVNKGVKTKKALDEKIFLEKRLDELHKEASNVRVALKRQPK